MAQAQAKSSREKNSRRRQANVAGKGMPNGAADPAKQTLVEEELRRSREEAQRLAREATILAEVGRIISSSLNIEEVYEKFAEETRKFISFKRIAVNLLDPSRQTGTVTYVSGTKTKGRLAHDSFTLDGSMLLEIARSGAGLIFHPRTAMEVEGRFPHLLPFYQAGMRSMMGTPLFHQNQVIGSLLFLSPEAQSYSGLRADEDPCAPG